MFPDIESQILLNEDSPFYNAFNIPDRVHATTVISKGMRDERFAQVERSPWVGLGKQIESLGVHHGAAVLEEISLLTKSRGEMNLNTAKAVLTVYCDQNMLEVPELDEKFQPSGADEFTYIPYV